MHVYSLVKMFNLFALFFIFSLLETSSSIQIDPVLYNGNVPKSNNIYYKKCAPIVTCDPNAKYRTINGSCNNLMHSSWGVSFTPYLRLAEGVYSDGDHKIRNQLDGRKLPESRKVQLALFLKREQDSPDIHNYHVNQLAQWMAHDISLTLPDTSGPESCCNIPVGNVVPDVCQAVIKIAADDPVYSKIGKTCMEFRRAMTTTLNFNCTITPQISMNQVSSFIDSSQLYGPTQSKSNSLRTFKNGKLKTDKINGHEFCPQQNRNGSLICDGRDNVSVCFEGGDLRANQHFGITLYQTMFTRFHNLIAKSFQKLNPKWTDEVLFQETRRFISAINQIMTYRDLLPILLGKKYTKITGLALSKYKRTVYNPLLIPQLTIEFAGSAFRVPHIIIPSKYNFIDENDILTNSVNLNEWMSISDPLIQNSNFDNLLRGMTYTSGRMPKPEYNYLISNFMFKYSISGYQDLLSVDIQRGRDTGLPPYNTIRELCGLSKARSFEDLADTVSIKNIRKLKKLYATVDDVDLHVGLLLEEPCPNAMVGPTARHIIGDVFYRLRYGDRFFYDVENQPGSFSDEQLNTLRQIDLGHIFCATSGMNEIPDDIYNSLPRFRRLSGSRNCRRHLLKIDLSAWK